MRPDFFLTSTEGYALEPVRKCFSLGRVVVDGWQDCILVRLEPSIPGQQYGLGDRDVIEVVLAARHAGESVRSPRRWPLAVHVARILTEADMKKRSFAPGELEVIGWGEIHRKHAGARAVERRQD